METWLIILIVALFPIWFPLALVLLIITLGGWLADRLARRGYGDGHGLDAYAHADVRAGDDDGVGCCAERGKEAGGCPG